MMKRRVCLMAVATDVVGTVLKVLPDSVEVTGNIEAFDRAVIILRLVGPGLPEWCEEPSNGDAYPWVVAYFGQAGMTFVQTGPIHSTIPCTNYSTVMEQIANQN